MTDTGFDLDNWGYSVQVKRNYGNGMFGLLPIEIPYDGLYHEYSYIKHNDHVQVKLDGNIVYDSHLFGNASKPKISARERELRKVEQSYWRHL